VPKDIPYPKLNDGESFEKLFKDLAMLGLKRWAAVLGVTAAVVGVGIVWWVRR
jgi:uncharacterized protein YjeT (DUF2065 family)